jgi:hypothetical protein
VVYETNKAMYQNCEHLKYKGGKFMTKSIYGELMQRVDSGETFHIDFKTRTMKVGKDFLVKNGEYDGARSFWPTMKMNDMLNVIEDLYQHYKYSLPSERSDSKRKKYFKALPIESLTDKQLIIADRREGAQARLEGFILGMILNGSFVWDEQKLGKWFWQSKNDPDLVILRSWIENN